MERVFGIVALLSGIAGAVGLVYSIALWDFWVFISAVVSLLNVYAWSLVSDMHKDVQELKKETYSTNC